MRVEASAGGSYWKNGKENGNYRDYRSYIGVYIGVIYWGYRGLYRGYILGLYRGLHRGYILGLYRGLYIGVI